MPARSHFFPKIEMKEASSRRKRIVTFGHNFAYMVSSFVVSLYVTVMINVLQEIIKLVNN